MAAGAAWVIGMRTVVRILGLVSTVILARLLTPADFGLIALATMLSAAVESLGMLSFDVWLIRHASAGRTHYDTVWTLTVIRGAVFASIILLSSAPLAAYFDEPRLFNLLLLLASLAGLQSLHNVGIVDFQKKLNFDKDFKLFTVPRLAAFVVTVSCGVAFRSYWALAAGIATNRLCALLLSYRMHPFRPRFSLVHWREVFDISKWMLAGNWLGFAYLRADTFILAKLVGAESLGIYTIAREIADLASSEIVAPIRRVMLPGYSQLRADPARLVRAFVDGFALIVFFGLPCAVGIGLVSEPLVHILLGAQWVDAIVLIKVLAWYAVASVGIANQGPMLISLGHVKTSTAIIAIGVLLLVPAFAWGAQKYGVYGGAVAASVVNVAMLAISLSVTLRYLRMSPWALIAGTWRAVVATALMYIVVTYALDLARDAVPLLGLLVGVVSGALTYIVAVLGLWILTGKADGPEHATVRLLARARRGQQAESC